MTNIEHRYYAFFDVDGTIIKGKPMLDFLKFYYLKKHARFSVLGKIRYSFFKAKSIFINLIGNSREMQNRLYYTCFKNQSKLYIANLGKEWFKAKISEDSYFQSVVDELNLHKSKGAGIVLVSGSFSACLNKIAEKLCLDYILATPLEDENGKYTGKLVSEPVIGYGKSKAILQFLQCHKKVDLRKCFAYGDHVSDVQMLSMVGNPVVIAGDAKLEEIASNNQWRVIYPG